MPLVVSVVHWTRGRWRITGSYVRITHTREALDDQHQKHHGNPHHRGLTYGRSARDPSVSAQQELVLTGHKRGFQLNIQHWSLGANPEEIGSSW